MPDDNTSQPNLSDLPESLRGRILSKFFKLKAATEACHLSDWQDLLRLNRDKIRLYQSNMLGDSNMSPEDDNITIADDIRTGIGWKELAAIAAILAGGIGGTAWLLSSSESKPAVPPPAVDTDTDTQYEWR